MKKITLLVITFMFFSFVLITAKTMDNMNLEGDEYLAFAEEMPQPVGGLNAIYDKVKYPEKAQSAGVQGKVYILAFINENGGVDDVKVVKGIGAGCDEAAIDAVKQAKFSPGKSGGKSVKVKYSIPIAFKMK